ncbi:hypothetical protein SEA_LUKER_24 [Gordonia phage Luker]|uniref:Uncharacterized protein n=1 Tax=Gordonia phage Luker TaxID=2591188 RepID=A0A514A4S7_9CAUD|nr:hypothetical protein SEA_LUKER_24 [Gordonia phage Luker]
MGLGQRGDGDADTTRAVLAGTALVVYSNAYLHGHTRPIQMDLEVWE